MRVSFSILCYNYGRYLAAAINSCLVQSIPGFETETLVIDDGSTDDTPEVCALYGDRIRVLRGPNLGFGGSLTKAVSEAHGEYVCFLDADDYFDQGRLSAVAPFLRERVPLIVGSSYFVDHDCNLIDENVQRGGNTSTLCVRKDAAISLLPVENEISFHAILAAGKSVYAPDAITYYRVHGNSMTNRTHPGKQNSYLAGVTHRLADRVARLTPVSARWLDSESQARRIARRFRAQAFYNELEAALELGHRRNARRALLKMLGSEFAWRSYLSVFALKMIVRTALMRPTFPKCPIDVGAVQLGRKT